MKKKIIILGSSGIISKNLQKKLKKNKIKFIVYGKEKINLVKKKSIKILRNKVSANDIIIFISAEAPAKNFDMFRNNIEMCENFCESIKDKKISKIIYISSDAVYSDSFKKLNENSQTLPSSMHGMMHLTRELILKIYCKNLCILRPTLVYGPGDTHKGYGPNKFLELAKKNKDIVLFGKGEELRDHVYIDDLIAILYMCIIKNKKGIFNIASGKINSFKRVAKTVISLSKSKSKIFNTKRVGQMPHNGYRPFDVTCIKTNFNKIKLTGIEQGITKYLRN
tara:strand:+ start:663 stop:1502 length:840 start_codon:yes stop_codon:yes gene_type:complete